MEKVKVKRYVSGKRPDYAPMESSDEEDEEFQFIKKAKEQEMEPEEKDDDLASDPRLRRLQNRISEDVEERSAQAGVLPGGTCLALTKAGGGGLYRAPRDGQSTGNRVLDV